MTRTVFRCSGSAGATRTLPEHFVEHLLNDETGRPHLDPFRRLAADRIVHIRILQREEQRRGTKTKNGSPKDTSDHCDQPNFHHQVVNAWRRTTIEIRTFRLKREPTAAYNVIHMIDPYRTIIVHEILIHTSITYYMYINKYI